MATATGASRQAALTAANAAVAALAAGTSFEDVARQYSTDAATKDKGGDYGSIFANDTTLDTRRSWAPSSPPTQGETTPLLTNADGSTASARVNGITPATADTSFDKDLRAAMSWDAYREQRAQGGRRGQARRVHRRGRHDGRPAAAPPRPDLARR